MDKTYSIYWSETALNELIKIKAYPPEIKENIYLDSFSRLEHQPTLTAKQINYGPLEGYWARLGLYQVILVFFLEEESSNLFIDGIKHKRENVYWRRQRKNI